jgi:hypothetical protein
MQISPFFGANLPQQKKFNLLLIKFKIKANLFKLLFLEVHWQTEHSLTLEKCFKLGDIIKSSAASNQLWLEYHFDYKIAVMKVSKTAEITQVTSIVANQCTKKSTWTCHKFQILVLSLTTFIQFGAMLTPKEQSHPKLRN